MEWKYHKYAFGSSCLVLVSLYAGIGLAALWFRPGWNDGTPPGFWSLALLLAIAIGTPLMLALLKVAD